MATKRQRDHSSLEDVGLRSRIFGFDPRRLHQRFLAQEKSPPSACHEPLDELEPAIAHGGKKRASENGIVLPAPECAFMHFLDNFDQLIEPLDPRLLKADILLPGIFEQGRILSAFRCRAGRKAIGRRGAGLLPDFISAAILAWPAVAPVGGGYISTISRCWRLFRFWKEGRPRCNAQNRVAAGAVFSSRALRRGRAGGR